MTVFYSDRQAAAVAAEKLKVFAQPQRLMILSCLLRGERNVGEIAETTGIGQPALSQQLAELRRAKLVHTRKEAKQVWYMLASEEVELCIRKLEADFSEDGAARRAAEAPLQTRAMPTAEGVARFAHVITRGR